MNDSCRQKRTEKSGQLLQSFYDRSLPRLSFEDEKTPLLTNRQNNQIYSKSRKCDVEQKIFIEGTRFSVKVMILASFI